MDVFDLVPGVDIWTSFRYSTPYTGSVTVHRLCSMSFGRQTESTDEQTLVFLIDSSHHSYYCDLNMSVQMRPGHAGSSDIGLQRLRIHDRRML